MCQPGASASCVVGPRNIWSAVSVCADSAPNIAERLTFAPIVGPTGFPAPGPSPDPVGDPVGAPAAGSAGVEGLASRTVPSSSTRNRVPDTSLRSDACARQALRSKPDGAASCTRRRNRNVWSSAANCRLICCSNAWAWTPTAVSICTSACCRCAVITLNEPTHASRISTAAPSTIAVCPSTGPRRARISRLEVAALRPADRRHALPLAGRPRTDAPQGTRP